MCLPGYRAGDWATTYLRSTLSRLGHHVSGWGIGMNHGHIGSLLPPLEDRLQHVGPTPITLVGWSLGGGIARELARRHPTRVAHVITLGTPVIGGPKYTATAHTYLKQGMDLEKMAEKQRTREQVPIPVPLTVIYSERDEFVCPAASVDVINAHAVHHVVNCSHTGLILAPEVHRLVAEAITRHSKHA
jgi:dienelactone hydrolase